jgi:hypothetical protein
MGNTRTSPNRTFARLRKRGRELCATERLLPSARERLPGSGPVQLALALAADVLGNDGRARDIYQRLKFKLIGGLPRDVWVLTEGRVRAAIDAVERDHGRDR